MTTAGVVALGTLLALVAVVGICAWLAPTWAPPGYWFGVPVTAQFRRSEEAAAALRAYRRPVLVSGMVAAALVAASLATHHLELMNLALLVPVLGMGLGYARGHRLTLPHVAPAEAIRVASLRPMPMPVAASLALQLGPVAIVLVSAVWLWLNWDRIPERFPMHWDAAERVNGWGAKTFGTVFLAPMLALFVLAGLIALSRFTATFTRRAPPGPAAEFEALQRRVLAWVLLAAEYSLAITTSGAALLPLAPRPELLVWVSSFGSFALVVGIIAAAVWLGRRARVTQAGGSAADALHWKWGLFYVNPDDPAVLVPKRFGLGYTLNFANKVAWLLLALLFAPAFVIAVVVVLHAR